MQNNHRIELNQTSDKPTTPKHQSSVSKRLVFSLISALVIMLSIFTFSQQAKVMAYVTIDVNSTFKLKLNSTYQVLTLVAIGDNDTSVSTKLELTGLAQDDQLLKLLDVLIENGYLRVQENSMVMYLDIQANIDPKVIKELTTSDIAKVLDSKTVTADVVTVATPKGGTKSTTTKSTTSTAKKQLMNALVKVDPTLTVTALTKLNINELTILATLKKVEFKDTTTINQPEASTQITEQTAIEIALKDAGLSLSEVSDLEVELETEDGITIFEVEFSTSTQEFKFYIDATNGTIIKAKHEIEEDDKDDDDDKDEIDDEESED